MILVTTSRTGGNVSGTRMTSLMQSSGWYFSSIFDKRQQQVFENQPTSALLLPLPYTLPTSEEEKYQSVSVNPKKATILSFPDY